MGLQTKFMSAIAGLSVVVLLLAGSSVRAVNSLDEQLERAVSQDAARMERIGQVVDEMVQLTGLHKDQLLRSVLSDTAGAEAARKAVEESNTRLESSFASLYPLLTDPRDRAAVDDLKAKADASKQISASVDDLIAKQQMNDALKIVSEKLIPSYEQILKQADVLREEQRKRLLESTASSKRSATASLVLTFCFVGLTLVALGMMIFLFRHMVRDLKRMALAVHDGAQRISGAAGQVNAVSRCLAQGATDQAASLEETSASAEEINAMVNQNAANSGETARLASVADALLGEANQKLDQMLASMQDISVSSEKISKIIRVIDEIAFQTNMLSLNAAVEAARAGEAGMGFAVVAEEVRNLAQRCSQAARDTSALIEESINHARVGGVRVNEVAAAMRQVTENSALVGNLSRELSTSSSEQARGIEQISKAITQIQMVTQSNASSAQQGAAAGATMSDEARLLQTAVEHLRALVGMGSEENEERSETAHQELAAF